MKFVNYIRGCHCFFALYVSCLVLLGCSKNEITITVVPPVIPLTQKTVFDSLKNLVGERYGRRISFFRDDTFINGVPVFKIDTFIYNGTMTISSFGYSSITVDGNALIYDRQDEVNHALIYSYHQGTYSSAGSIQDNKQATYYYLLDSLFYEFTSKISNSSYPDYQTYIYIPKK